MSTTRKAWSLSILGGIAAIVALPGPASAQMFGRAGRGGNGRIAVPAPRGSVAPRQFSVATAGRGNVAAPVTALINQHGSGPSRGFNSGSVRRGAAISSGRGTLPGRASSGTPAGRGSRNAAVTSPVNYNNDPNPVVSSTQSSSSYWDPIRGWITNSRQDTEYLSARSPGRAPAPGAPIYNNSYWDGTRWVQSQSWLGTDGQWHGQSSVTQYGPNGSSTTTAQTISNEPRK
jgi:hypothetical protein